MQTDRQKQKDILQIDCVFTPGDKDSLLTIADGTKPKASGPAAGSAAKTSTMSSASASGDTSAQSKSGVNADGIICSFCYN